MARRFILADRDGTLIVEKNYLHNPDEVELIEGVGESLKHARDLGWGIVCVSNQAGVGRGYFEESAVIAVNEKVESMLNNLGAKVDRYYFCPDHPDSESTHRKPAPGMARDAATDFDIDLSQSIVIGDKPCDIELGQAVGAKTVLVRTGYGRKHEELKDCSPDYVIDSIADLSAILDTFPR